MIASKVNEQHRLAVSQARLHGLASSMERSSSSANLLCSSERTADLKTRAIYLDRHKCYCPRETEATPIDQATHLGSEATSGKEKKIRDVESGHTGLATYLCPPSTGLPDCRRPASGPFRLALDLRDGLAPPGFWEEELIALPDAPLAAGIVLTVEAMEEGRQVKLASWITARRTAWGGKERSHSTPPGQRIESCLEQRGTREKPRGLNGRAEGGEGRRTVRREERGG